MKLSFPAATGAEAVLWERTMVSGVLLSATKVSNPSCASALRRQRDTR
jgi:hypothetical protein